MTNVARLTGATTFWQNGWSGQGVDVALLDSGVLPGRGPQRRRTSSSSARTCRSSRRSATCAYLDTFGHGTHMAGIIAGRDAGVTPGDVRRTPRTSSAWRPASRIVSVKVADAHGRDRRVPGDRRRSTGWCARHDPGMNIRVLNLSFGTDSTPGLPARPAGARRRGRLAAGASSSSCRPATATARTTRAGQPGDRPGRASPSAPWTPRAPRRPHGRRRRRPSPRGATRSRASADRTWWRPGSSIVSLRAPGSFIDQLHGDGRRVGARGSSRAAARRSRRPSSPARWRCCCRSVRTSPGPGPRRAASLGAGRPRFGLGRRGCRLAGPRGGVLHGQPRPSRRHGCTRAADPWTRRAAR